MPGIILDNTPHDIGWVRATMMFPNDDVARRQLFGVEFARCKVLECKDTDRLEVDAGSLRLLIEAPAYDVLKNIVADNTKRAIVAGDILTALYLMDKFKVPEPSMNKAVFMAMEFAKTAKYGDGTPMNISERMVRKYWEEYKPVAHLWAAFRINLAYPYAPADDVLCRTEFLEVAVGLFDFGSKFISFRAKTPVLDAEKCWALPDSIVARNLESDQVPDRLLKYLKKYKAPRSRV